MRPSNRRCLAMVGTSLQDKETHGTTLRKRFRPLLRRINNLREQLEFHEKWLRIEMPDSAQKYGRLVKEVRAAAGTAIADAWRTGPVKSAEDMNIGALDISRNQVEEAVEEFSSAVVKELSWWRL